MIMIICHHCFSALKDVAIKKIWRNMKKLSQYSTKYSIYVHYNSKSNDTTVMKGEINREKVIVSLFQFPIHTILLT